jgi:hypothetical protein
MIDNYQSIENNNGLSVRDINSLLNAKWKVNIDKVVNLINLYNSLYKSSLLLENMFNTQYIKDYIIYKNKLKIEYNQENKSWFLDIFFIVLKNIKTNIKDIFDKVWYDVKVKNRNLLLVILFVIITLITIFSLYNIIWNTDWNSSLLRIEKISK